MADVLPETMELQPSRLKWFVVFLAGLGFSIIGFFLGDNMEAWKRWGIVAFFALIALVAIPQIVGVGGSLKLDRKGFTCRALLRSFRREWHDCSVFYPVRVPFRKFVGFSTAQDEAAHPGLSAVNRDMIGAAGMLPDTYGMSADALSDLMNRFRARALGLSA